MHILGDDLERYHLGTVHGPESETIEEHILGCSECADRAAEIGEHIDAMRAAMAKMRPRVSSANP